jgi:hypothetical protein
MHKTAYDLLAAEISFRQLFYLPAQVFALPLCLLLCYSHTHKFVVSLSGCGSVDT